MGDKLRNRWAKLRIQLLTVLLHLGAHPGHNLGHVRVNGPVQHACTLQYGPQDTYVSISVNRYALNASLNAQHVADCSAEGKIVNCVAAVQQRAVNIEEESISAVPAESGTHERSSSAGIWRQVWHFDLDAIAGNETGAPSGPAFVCPVAPAFRFVQDGGRHRAAGGHPASAQRSSG